MNILVSLDRQTARIFPPTFVIESQAFARNVDSDEAGLGSVGASAAHPVGADDRLHLGCGVRRSVRHAHIAHERALCHTILVVIVFIVHEGALASLLLTLGLEQSSQLDSCARGRISSIICELGAKFLGLAFLTLIALDSLRKLGLIASKLFILHG